MGTAIDESVWQRRRGIEGVFGRIDLMDHARDQGLVKTKLWPRTRFDRSSRGGGWDRCRDGVKDRELHSRLRNTRYGYLRCVRCVATFNKHVLSCFRGSIADSRSGLYPLHLRMPQGSPTDRRVPGAQLLRSHTMVHSQRVGNASTPLSGIAQSSIASSNRPALF